MSYYKQIIHSSECVSAINPVATRVYLQCTNARAQRVRLANCKYTSVTTGLIALTHDLKTVYYLFYKTVLPLTSMYVDQVEQLQ